MPKKSLSNALLVISNVFKRDHFVLITLTSMNSHAIFVPTNVLEKVAWIAIW